MGERESSVRNRKPMKQVCDLPPETLARLMRIEASIVENQLADPWRYTYRCHLCSDSGYVVEDVVHRHMKQTYRVGRPCESCGLGIKIKRRMVQDAAERGSKAGPVEPFDGD